MSTELRMPKAGDIVTRYAGAAHFEVVALTLRDPVGHTDVQMRSLRSGRRSTERLACLRWVNEDGTTGDWITPASITRAPSVERAGETPIVWMMCAMCGAAVPTDNPEVIWYWCVGCDRTSEHLVVGILNDEAERQNEQRNALLRQLHAAEDMLRTLGVRLTRKHMRDAAEVLAERGRGAQHWIIRLADDLTVEQQVEYLGKAWEYLCPANEPRWVTDEWHTRSSDDQMQWKGFAWSRSEKEANACG